jgi:hypothetical protein
MPLPGTGMCGVQPAMSSSAPASDANSQLPVFILTSICGIIPAIRAKAMTEQYKQTEIALDKRDDLR